MKNTETGGPAFPSKKRIHRAGYPTNEFEPVDGMTLRDAFAISAMQMKFGQSNHSLSLEQMAKVCYEMADAMLEARK